jgi:hypothetical protein
LHRSKAPQAASPPHAAILINSLSNILMFAGPSPLQRFASRIKAFESETAKSSAAC